MVFQVLYNIVPAEIPEEEPGLVQRLGTKPAQVDGPGTGGLADAEKGQGGVIAKGTVSGNKGDPPSCRQKGVKGGDGITFHRHPGLELDQLADSLEKLLGWGIRVHHQVIVGGGFHKVHHLSLCQGGAFGNRQQELLGKQGDGFVLGGKVDLRDCKGTG